nr:hypothetical protein [Prosthecochloris sp. CIB 2401]
MKTTPKWGTKISFNTEAGSCHISRCAGFQALLSSGIKASVEVLRGYRDKDSLEMCFCFLWIE